MSRARRLGLAVVATLLAVLAIGSSGEALAQGSPAPLAVDRLAECVARTGRLSAVLLVDESASLKRTDPDDERVEALQAALITLYGLAQTDIAGTAPTIEVKLAGFASSYRPVGGWTELDPGSLGEVRENAEQFRSRDAGVDTDYVAALTGARDDLDARAAEVTEEGGTSVCKAIFWFTDGGFDIGLRTSAEQADELGQSKPYAEDVDLRSSDGVREAIEAGRRELCRRDGLVDEIRSGEVFVIAVAMGLAQGGPNDPEGFLQALTEGEAESGFTCGDPEAAAETGAYARADDVDSLLDTFIDVICQLRGCGEAEGPTELAPGETEDFVVDRAVGRVVVGVTAASAGELTLSDPAGVSATVPIGADRSSEIGTATIDARAVGEGRSLIAVELPVGTTDHEGTWRLSNTSSGPIQRTITFESGVEPTLAPGAAFERGIRQEIGLQIGDRAGDPVPADAVQGALEVTGEVVDPVSGKRAPAEVSVAADGTGTLTYSVPNSTRASSVRVVLRLGGTFAGGLAMSPVVRSYPVPVVVDPSLPRVLTEALLLPSLSQKVPDRPDRTTATSVIELEGSPLGDGRACIEGADLLAAPRGTTKVEAEEACVEVPKGKAVELPIALSPEEIKNGTVRGAVSVQLSSDRTGAQASTAVPFEGQMRRGINTAGLIAVFVLIMLLSLAIPVGLMWLWSWATSGFDPDTGVRWAVVPVEITDGHLSRQGTDTTLTVGASEWRFLADGVDGRVARLRQSGGGATDMETPYTIRAKAHLLRIPTAVIESSDGPVLGSEGFARSLRRGRRGQVPHGLFGAWALALTSAEPPDGDVITSGAGDLIVFVDDEWGWEVRLIEVIASASVAARGADARSLAEAVVAGTGGVSSSSGGDHDAAGPGTPVDEADEAEADVVDDAPGGGSVQDEADRL